jgi:hypothetical protein
MSNRSVEKGGPTAKVRAEAVDGALHALLTIAPAALRAVLSPSRLVGSGNWTMSRDTAYRLFRDDHGFSGADAVVAACSTRSVDPEWNGVTETLNEIATAYVAEHSTVLDRLRAALEADVVASFDSPGWPVGHLLQGAALSASPRWAGPRPTDPADIALASAILDDRRRHYEELTDLYEPLLRRMMSDTGLRPDGRTTRQVVRLTHCLIDGAVLRMFVDPTLEAEDVAEAIVRFGLSLGEPGAIDDPRRPDDAGRAPVFDALIEAAVRWWTEHSELDVPDIAVISARADVPEAASAMLLPSQADLADSVVRSLLVDGGFLGSGAEVPARSMIPMMVIGGLERMAREADRLPGPFRLLAESDPVIGRSLRSESVQAVAMLLREAGLGDSSNETAAVLTEAAWAGKSSLASQAKSIGLIRKLAPKSDRT